MWHGDLIQLLKPFDFGFEFRGIFGKESRIPVINDMGSQCSIASESLIWRGAEFPYRCYGESKQRVGDSAYRCFEEPFFDYKYLHVFETKTEKF